MARHEELSVGDVLLGNDIIIFGLSGAPSDGTSGTKAGVAGPGSLCLSTSGTQYTNVGTKASPSWQVSGLLS